MKLVIFTFLVKLFGQCNSHYLDDYYAAGTYLPEMWLEFPFMGYFEHSVHLPNPPTRGNSPSSYGASAAYPTPTNSLNGITCEVQHRNFRFWWYGPFFGSFDSISIVVHVKQPDGHGPILSDSTSLGVANCYIGHGYEEEDGRLDQVLSSKRGHARCGTTLSRVLAVENCPVDEGVQLALVYDHLKNKMRLYCDDNYDEVDTVPGLKPSIAEYGWNFCTMNGLESSM